MGTPIMNNLEWLDNIDHTPTLTKVRDMLKDTRRKGTCIVAARNRNIAIVATDTRESAGPIVVNEECNKLHQIGDELVLGGMGASWAVDHYWYDAIRKYRTRLAVNGEKFSAREMVHSTSFDAYFNVGVAALYLGAGFGADGPVVFDMTTGCYFERFCTANGSGGFVATEYLNDNYDIDCTDEELRSLCIEAVCRAIRSDSYCGTAVDLCTISREGSKLERKVDTRYFNPRDRTESIQKFKTPIPSLLRPVPVETLLY